MDQLAELNAAEKNLHKIQISNVPEFNKRFILLNERGEAIIQLFTIERGEKLLQIKNGLELCVNSDLFILKRDFN